LARHFGEEKVNVTGVTITRYQVKRGNEWTRREGVKNVRAVWGNLLDLKNTAGIADNSIDIAWSFESEHHIIEKQKMSDEIMRVLKPGGLLILQSMNRRKDPPLTPEEDSMMNFIELGGACPEWSTIAAMEEKFAKAGLINRATDDWGPKVGVDWWISLWVGLLEDDLLSRWWKGQVDLPLNELRLMAKDFYITYVCGKAYVGDNPPAQQGLLRGTKQGTPM
jgi:SAM-dependent methyltransferase